MAAGSLDLKIGGRSFTPDSDDSSQRRGVYITRGFATNRDVTPQFLQTFDVDDGRVPCPIRTQTVTAPQSLFLMNSPEVESASARLASRVRKETANDLKQAIELTYRLTVARPPSTTEQNLAFDYLEGDAERLNHLAWLIFNLDEFIYVR